MATKASRRLVGLIPRLIGPAARREQCRMANQFPQTASQGFASVAASAAAWADAFHRNLQDRYAMWQRSMTVAGSAISALPKVDFLSLRAALLLIEEHNKSCPVWEPPITRVRKFLLHHAESFGTLCSPYSAGSYPTTARRASIRSRTLHAALRGFVWVAWGTCLGNAGRSRLWSIPAFRCAWKRPDRGQGRVCSPSRHDHRLCIVSCY